MIKKWVDTMCSRKKIKFLFSSIILFIFISCDAFYIIPLNDKSETLNLNFECGQVDIYLQNWKGHAFDFYQDFDVNNNVTLNLDSLKIKFRNNYYPCYFVGVSDSTKLTILGQTQVRTAFEIQRRVNKGDTIFVYPKGYIHCNGQAVQIDTLVLIMKEDLRGPMGS